MISLILANTRTYTRTVLSALAKRITHNLFRHINLQGRKFSPEKSKNAVQDQAMAKKSKPSATNSLYYGDNLEILRRHIPDESVDLAYLDPPFNSNQDYNVLFKHHSGADSSAQIKAFTDTWHWSHESAQQYEALVESGGAASRAMEAFWQVLGPSDMLAYIAMMAPRLIELRRTLKPTGSIYLHCDPTASHYLKILLDAIFGPTCYRNEIVWKRTSAHSDSATCGKTHDIIFLYTKGKEFTWNPQFQPYDEKYIKSHYRRKTETGRLYRTGDLTAMGLSGGGYEYEWNGVTKLWRQPKEKMQALHDEGRIHYTRSGTAEYIRFLDEMPGMPLQDIWDDISPVNSQAAERMGYPTQKPVTLLERIISASSNPGEVVLDSFCGCGTSIEAAEKLDRKWIGIDITFMATNLIKYRLDQAFGGAASYQIRGEPTTVQEATHLAKTDPYQFQWWSLGLVKARPADEKKGADKGIDGRLYFQDEKPGTAKSKQVIFSVKAGKPAVSHLRDLRGVLDRENAEIGVLITMQPSTSAMTKEAATGGFYKSTGWGQSYPRLQILTIEELLAGKTVQKPPSFTDTTFPDRAPSRKEPEPVQPDLIPQKKLSPTKKKRAAGRRRKAT